MAALPPSEVADEPNGTVITVGGSLTGAIDFSGDRDNYSISLVAGQTYMVSLRGTGTIPLNDPFLGLINPAFTAFVAIDDDGGNNINSLFTFTAAETGIYTIRAQAFPGDPGTGTYTIDVREQGADAVGDTNATAASIGLGTTFGFRESGTGGTPISPLLAGDVDRYAINLVAGQFYTFNLAGGADYATNFAAVPPGELDTVLILRDSAGNILSINDDINFPSDISSSIGFLAPTSGTYYIDTTAYAGQTGGYALDVSQVDPSTLNPLDAFDWRRANDVPFVDVDGVPTAYVYFGAAGETFGQTADDGVSPMVTFGWQQHEIDAVMLALEQFEQVLGTNYVITTDVNQATFRLATTSSTQFEAYFIPQDPAFGADQGVGVFSVRTEWSLPGSLDQGGFSFGVILHEFGHAHGLAHPHDRGGGSDILLGVTGPFNSLGAYDLNQGVYTVMSYNFGWQRHPDGRSVITPASVDNGWSGTLAAFDIAQLHRRYGAVPANTGNDVYALTDVVDDAFYRTIWDTGGIDTISYGGSLNAQIDLTAATLDYSPTGGGVVSFLRNLPGLPDSAEVKGGYTIANGVVIENATGGSGHDVLIGNAANNVLTGNAGEDFILGGAGGDTVDGGAGIDTASYRTSASGVDVDLRGDAEGGDAQGDRLISIENLEGSNFGDELRGNAANNRILGLDGNDELRGENGDDTVDGGGGDDEVRGGNGNDIVNGGAGNDDVRGDNGDDIVNGGAGNDRVRGGNGNDTLNGGGGDDRLEGGLGLDIFRFTEGGSETIIGYQSGEKIDLTGIAVDFTFIGAAAFSGTVGELRVVGGLVQGDFDGNGVADISVQLFGSPLNSADLLFN